MKEVLVSYIEVFLGLVVRYVDFIEFVLKVNSEFVNILFFLLILLSFLIYSVDVELFDFL